MFLCYTINGLKQIIMGFLTFNIYGSNYITIKGFSTITINVFQKTFLGFEVLPFLVFKHITWCFFSRQHWWFFSVTFNVFCTNFMNGSLRNISGFSFITIFGIQAYHIMLFINTLMVYCWHSCFFYHFHDGFLGTWFLCLIWTVY